MSIFLLDGNYSKNQNFLATIYLPALREYLNRMLVVACSVNSDKQFAKDCRVVQQAMGEVCIPRNPQRDRDRHKIL